MKDSTMAKEAAGVMKLTAGDLKRLGIVEQVFPEPAHYTVQNLKKVVTQLERELERFFIAYGKLPAEELTEHRYDRFRKM